MRDAFRDRPSGRLARGVMGVAVVALLSATASAVEPGAEMPRKRIRGVKLPRNPGDALVCSAVPEPPNEGPINLHATAAMSATEESGLKLGSGPGLASSAVPSGPPLYLVESESVAPQGGWFGHAFPEGPAGGWAGAMVYDAARGRILFSDTDNQDAPSLWQWNGYAWSRITPTEFVTAESVLMAYDSTRQKVIRVGVREDEFPEYGAWGFNEGHTSEWDGKAWLDKTPATSFTPVGYAAVAFDAARGKLVLFGGAVSERDGGPADPLDETWEWDGTTWLRRWPAHVPVSRWGHAMAYDSVRQRVVMAGGYHPHDWDAYYCGDTWEWDGNDWILVAQESFPAIRVEAAMAFDESVGRVVMFGGWGLTPGGYLDFLADTWEWDGATWTERTSATSPPARESASMAYDAGRGRMVLFGGYNGDLERGLADTWEWDGSDWLDVSPPAISPLHAVDSYTPRALAFDRGRQATVLFGSGMDLRSWAPNPVLNWAWDGANWTEESATPNPHMDPNYFGLWAAYDEARARMVVVVLNGETVFETWEWDNTSWQLLSTGYPIGIQGLVYHAARGRVVRVSAQPLGSPYAKQWEWDGIAWSEIPALASLPNRSNFLCAYDRGRDRLVVYGGQELVSPFQRIVDELWEFDGASWEQRLGAGSPGPRADGNMVYDEARGRTVLYGGASDRVGIFDTWEWDGDVWTETTPDVMPKRRAPSYPYPLPDGPVVVSYDAARQRVAMFTSRSGTLWSYGPIDACASATDVISFSPGSGTDASAAAGMLGAMDGQAVSLGVEGSVVLRVVPPISDRSGTDFVVHEADESAGEVKERLWVEVSTDGSTYEFATDCLGGDCLVDIARTDLAVVSYVKVTDVAPQETDTAPPRLGTDIDAVSAVHCAEICNGLDDDRDGVVDNGGGALCSDGNICTDDACGGATGCVHTDNSAACSDGNACTQLDTCSGGTCVGGSPVICSALAPCHAAGVCDPATGVCSNPNQPDGTICTDDNLCTTGDACQAGVCTPTHNGLNEPNPRTNGYYKRLCHGPHSGDQLTDADAACVAQVTATFAGITTVALICEEIEPSHPNNDRCDQTEDDLMVLALNICRARVCTEQSIDSRCGGNAHVGQSLAESDAILDSPSRNFETCSQAKCLDEEINTGEAIEMNTLTLNLEGGHVRLDWSPPYFNDGTGVPDRYDVWRRALGSLSSFMKIGETVSPVFLDTTSGSGAFEYEITALMN